MKKSFKSRILSTALTCAMLLTTPVGAVRAAAEDTGKYISEVFIAYGKTEDEAKSWLTSHGWEPVEGNFNAGKADSVAAVMGIKRTNDPKDAVTDMAVMNMGTEGYMGYSFDDYQSLLNEKKADIDEFVDSFMPVIEEYRANYKGDGSPAGQARAQAAHELLNKFYDGEIDGQYAVNDTGMPLGDLFLNTTRRELGEDKYNALSKNEQVKYGDLQQIILESSAGALQTVEQVLALAADSNEDTWLDRLEEMSDLDMKTMAELYADGNASLSESAAESLLMSKYGDAAEMLESEYQDIQMELLWYTNYMDTNGLRMQDGETDDAYSARLNAYFDEIKQRDGEDAYDDITGRFYATTSLYTSLLMVPYEGEWGETLFEFFCNQNGGDYEYAEDTPAFLPFAIALSEGQRAGLQFLSFRTLLQLGVSCDDTSVITDTVPDMGDVESVSIYSGINRAIFRSGVALTSRAMMDKSRGQSPYDQMWDAKGVFSIASLGTFAVGTVLLVIGAEIYAKYTRFDYAAAIATKSQTLERLRLSMSANKAARDGVMNQFIYGAIEKKEAETKITGLVEKYNEMVGKETTAKQKINSLSEMQDQAARMSKAARWIMGIGGVMLLASAAMAGYRLYKYYNRTFLPIPLYIVDEADIVSYTTDKNDNEVKNIDFDQYVYYEVVKCNRQDIGVNEHAQDGVDQYAEWGCGDAADLNCDVGKQWLALYTVKSDKKGAPILADSLKLQYGSDAMPSGCTAPLHFFTYTHAADLGDLAYAFNNNKNGVYFFWDTDANAFTATAFTGGQLALAGIGGLVVGILGATVVMLSTKKRKDVPEAPAVA